jgi:inner membrane protein
MLIAHAPAGYLLARLFSRTMSKEIEHSDGKDRWRHTFIAAGILGGIFPDLDLIYQFFFDPFVDSHHSYVTHLPVFWLAAWCVLFCIGTGLRNRSFIALSTIFCLSAGLHLALDTLTGVIYWFYPISGKGLNLFKVADVHVWWVHNYMYHWTFLFEIGIVTVAMTVFLRVKESARVIVHLFRRQEKLRSLAIRLGVCVLGIAVIAIVGSLKFTIDNKAVAKIIKMKHYVARMFDS